MHWKDTRIALSSGGALHMRFLQGTFEINKWVMGLLKKGATCPVSLLPWCVFMLRECVVMVWWPPTPAM